MVEEIISTKGCAIGSLVKKIQADQDLQIQLKELTDFLPNDSSVSFRLYHIRNGLAEQKKCKECKTKLNSHHKEFCDRKCSNRYNQNLQSVQEKKSESLSKAHSKRSQKEKDAIKTKRKQTCIKRFGAVTNLTTEDSIEKRSKTWKEKYGVDHPCKSRDVKEIISKKNRKSAKGALKKRIQTCIDRYGVKSVFLLKEVQEKIKKSNIEKYGAENPMQNEEFYSRYFSNSYKKYKHKKYSLPSGRIINLMGYEPQVLDLLLNRFDETDIAFGYEAYKETKVSYKEANKEKRYIPDFYIRSKKLIIEVKSEYTYTTVNKKKRENAIKLGYNFVYAIYENGIKFKRYEEDKSPFCKKDSKKESL